MPEPKHVVFISHIEEEKDIAISFKELVEHHFLGLIDSFVSSDGQSIESGGEWFNDLIVTLEKCALMIVVCSPMSIKRPWINFEAGAGWVRGVNVTPLCHSGMTRDALPIPYSLRQAANATTATHLEHIFAKLARTLGSRPPTADFTQFIQNTREFEERHTFWEHCNAAFARLRQVQPAVVSYLREALRQGADIGMKLSPTEADALKPHMLFLEEHNILRHEESGSIQIVAGMDPATVWNLYPLENLNSILTDNNFQFVDE